ncbi:MAG: hypothetical protein IJN88_06390 [Clostridia bacterium]|nr:hypothetical protein [Clostridia bacterium]
MKKLLSVLLAVLMLFSVMSVSASAAYLDSGNIQDYIEDNGVFNDGHFVAYFDCGSFTTKTPVYLYNVTSNNYELFESGLTGAFYLVPSSATPMYIGDYLDLPNLMGTDTLDFDGWAVNGSMDIRGGGSKLLITEDLLDDHGIVRFYAKASNAEPAEDTMAKVVDILCRIFGAIYGLLFCNGDTELGIKTVQEILGGIMG